MTTKQAILDVAMRLIGASTFTDGDGSKSDLVTDDFYDETLKDLLRQHPWNFATSRVELNQGSATPIGFDYAYEPPADFVRTVQVSSNDNFTGPPPVYKEEVVDGFTRFLCSADHLWLRYVAEITDPSVMPPDFRRAFEFALARDCALPIAESSSMRDTMSAEATRVLARARSADGMGQTPERRPRGSWVDSRHRALPVIGD